ncbi:MAG TPA: hypothetical protein VFG73_05630 [Rhodanobacteraceae bacterium]|nr:hypothetical protein [Rhodanobacteraceae bacterium]
MLQRYCFGFSKAHTFSEDAGEGKQLIRSADEAMYAAKKAGGNRTLVARAEPVG